MLGRRRVMAVLLAAGFAGSAAQAAPIFSDNFNADLRGLNKTTFVGGWTVGNGTVDVLGAGPGNEPGAGPGQPGDATGFNPFPANGNFIDLDGSSGDAGVFTKLLTLTGGTAYTALFDLAGSQRESFETVFVEFGTTVATYSLGPNAAFTRFALVFTPGSTGSYALRFAESVPLFGGLSNNQGLLLDNVLVSDTPGIGGTVPEPASWGLVLAALAGCTACTRRPRQLPG